MGGGSMLGANLPQTIATASEVQVRFGIGCMHFRYICAWYVIDFG